MIWMINKRTKNVDDHTEKPSHKREKNTNESVFLRLYVKIIRIALSNTTEKMGEYGKNV